MSLLLLGIINPFCGSVHFVNYDELRAVDEEGMLISLAFDEINAYHLEGIIFVDGFTMRGFSFQLGDGSGAYNHCVHIEFLREFLLPLFAEVGRAEDGEAFYDSSVVELAGDEEGFNCFSHADIVGDEEADGVDFQSHQEGDELVGAWANGDATERAEGSGAFPQGKAGGMPEELTAVGV